MPPTPRGLRFACCWTIIRPISHGKRKRTCKRCRGVSGLYSPPTHGSWLNLVETLFSKMARSMLRGIRVATKEELIQRIHQYFEEVNSDPVVFRWKYKLDEVTID